MAHARTAVREYAVDLVKNNVDVGGRVFANRPDPVFLSELPCALVYFSDEQNDIIGGDTMRPRVYQRNLRLNVDILVEEQLRPNTNKALNQAAEDLCDKLADQCERAFFNDHLFAKSLPDYDANTNWNIGLLLGSRLAATTPYNTDSDGETRIVAQRLQWELPYDTALQGDKKYKNFLSYKADIIRINSDEDTVDRVLREAEGEF
jgi:hypothetical protein